VTPITSVKKIANTVQINAQKINSITTSIIYAMKKDVKKAAYCAKSHVVTLIIAIMTIHRLKN
jgi:hypothetical protein